MKSIMQEASSIMKAIEKGWEAAGKPKEFSIKVFEEAKKNFIGMTTQSAKVGIFFNEHTAFRDARTPDKNQKRPERKPQFEQPKRQHPATQPVQHPASQQRRFESQRPPAIQEQRQTEAQQQRTLEPRSQNVWQPDMIEQANGWMKETLQTLNKENVSFNTTTDNYQLRFTFNSPVIEDVERERHLFRNLSFLLLCSLKRSYKRPLRGFKVVLTR
ncbi:hypothetical protein HYX58_06365 [Candidatus Dependentiae bacterium]|nr:hypothetical protein [Candidatus Dependentiae bacterium]